MKRPGAEPGAKSLPEVSGRLFRAFSGYGRWYVRRHFHALRLSGAPPRIPAGEPVIVYMNHPSWWDPMTGLVLANAYFGRRTHYAPIDAAAVEQYRFFAKIGFFGVEPDSVRGAATFLRTGRRILAQPSTALWVTAQGHFTDTRQRPVRLKGGVAHLAQRMQRGYIVPLAVEYPFWTERLPEALARFGQPIDLSQRRAAGTDGWQRVLESSLERAMDELAQDAQSRQAERFTTVLAGGAGVSLVYDTWRRVAAALRGRRFEPEHAAVTRSEVARGHH